MPPTTRPSIELSDQMESLIESTIEELEEFGDLFERTIEELQALLGRSG